MQAGNALRLRTSGGDFGDRQGRCIRCQHGIGSHPLLELAKQGTLGRDVLDDGLDHNPRSCALIAGADRFQAAEHILLYLGGHVPFRHQPFETFVDRGDGLLYRVAV